MPNLNQPASPESENDPTERVWAVGSPEHFNEILESIEQHRQDLLDLAHSNITTPRRSTSITPFQNPKLESIEKLACPYVRRRIHLAQRTVEDQLKECILTAFPQIDPDKIVFLHGHIILKDSSIKLDRRTIKKWYRELIEDALEMLSEELLIELELKPDPAITPTPEEMTSLFHLHFLILGRWDHNLQRKSHRRTPRRIPPLYLAQHMRLEKPYILRFCNRDNRRDMIRYHRELKQCYQKKLITEANGFPFFLTYRVPFERREDYLKEMNIIHQENQRPTPQTDSE